MNKQHQFDRYAFEYKIKKKSSNIIWAWERQKLLKRTNYIFYETIWEDVLLVLST